MIRKKNPYCKICCNVKVKSKYALKSGDDDKYPHVKKYADLLLMDHMVLRKHDIPGLEGERNALAIYDVATDSRDQLPVESKSAPDAEKAVKDVVGRVKVKEIYSDCSKELDVVADDLGALHPTSTPHRPTSHAKIETEHARTTPLLVVAGWL